MHPFLRGGEQVVLSPFDDGMLCRGAVVLARIAPERFVIHRIVKRKEHELTLMGDGNRTCEICRTDDVLGLLTAIARKKKSYRTEDRLWRYYSAVWMRLLSVRRFLLAVYRRL